TSRSFPSTRSSSPKSRSRSAPLRPANRRSKERRRAKRSATALAVDRRDRRERRTARLAAAEQFAAAFRTLVGHLRLELLEPAPASATFDADGDPVAEH